MGKIVAFSALRLVLDLGCGLLKGETEVLVAAGCDIIARVVVSSGYVL